MIKLLFKKVVVYYETTERDGSKIKGMDSMKIWEIPKWLKWFSPPSWLPTHPNQGIKTVITGIDFDYWYRHG